MENNCAKSLTGRARRFFEPSASQRAKSNPKIKYLNCKLCNAEINCNTEGNMVPHLRLKHKDEYNSCINIDREDPLVTRLKLLHSCVEIVTVNGKAFTTLSCSGFLKSHADTLQQLSLAGHPLNLSDPHLVEVKKNINIAAGKIRERIRNEVKGKVVSLLIDGATRNNRSLLAVSIQYIINGKVKVVPIGVKELLQRHTAIYLCSVIKNTLEQYGIRLRSILTVTSDNASNMIATTHQLEIELNKAIIEDCGDNDNVQENESTVDSNERFYSIDEEINKCIEDDEEQEVVTDDEALNMILDESSLYDVLLNNVTHEINKETGNHNLFVDQIRCAAHTLQLSINDALKKLRKEDANVIKLCRKVAKFMRLPSTKNELNGNQIFTIFPLLDVETRWNSTYLMVCKLNG